MTFATPADRMLWICAERDKGRTCAAIARDLGISAPNVSRLSAKGYRIRKRRAEIAAGK